MKSSDDDVRPAEATVPTTAPDSPVPTQQPSSPLPQSAVEIPAKPANVTSSVSTENAEGASTRIEDDVSAANVATSKDTSERPSGLSSGEPENYYAVFVGGMLTYVAPYLLREAFSSCGLFDCICLSKCMSVGNAGEVVSVKYVPGKTYAFVQFKNESSIQTAIDKVAYQLSLMDCVHRGISIFHRSTASRSSATILSSTGFVTSSLFCFQDCHACLELGQWDQDHKEAHQQRVGQR